MIGVYIATGACVVLVVAAGWLIIRLLALTFAAEPAELDSAAVASEFEEPDEDSEDWSWRSMADVA